MLYTDGSLFLRIKDDILITRNLNNVLGIGREIILDDLFNDGYFLYPLCVYGMSHIRELSGRKIDKQRNPDYDNISVVIDKEGNIGHATHDHNRQQISMHNWFNQKDGTFFRSNFNNTDTVISTLLFSGAGIKEIPDLIEQTLGFSAKGMLVVSYSGIVNYLQDPAKNKKPTFRPAHTEFKTIEIK